MPQTIDARTEDLRQLYLDWLYARSGRTNGLYTGLFQQRLRELIEQDMVMAALRGQDPALP